MRSTFSFRFFTFSSRFPANGCTAACGLYTSASTSNRSFGKYASAYTGNVSFLASTLTA